MSEPNLLAVRKRVAAGLLLIGSVAWGLLALQIGGWTNLATAPWTAWNLMGAITVAVASFGLIRRSLLVQIFARGAALWAIALALPPWSISSWLVLRLVTAMLGVAALYVASPALDTESAQAEFSPLRYRKVFLAGATASVALAISSGFGALWQAVAFLDGRPTGDPGEIWGPAVLVIPFLASAVGVVRMRAWGVLLGVATAVGSIACALPVLNRVSFLGLAYVCIPGFLLAAPLLAARLQRPAPARVPDPKLRVEPAPEYLAEFLAEALPPRQNAHDPESLSSLAR